MHVHVHVQLHVQLNFHVHAQLHIKALFSYISQHRSYREELSVAKMLYNSYIHQANDFRQQIQDNEQEVKVLTVKAENTRAAESLIDEKVQCVAIATSELRKISDV